MEFHSFLLKPRKRIGIAGWIVMDIRYRSKVLITNTLTSKHDFPLVASHKVFAEAVE